MARPATHGLSYHPLMRTWLSMKARCYNRNDKRFADWGGRGIYVCDEWKQNNVAFINWALENGWAKELQIDRINNDGPYSPNNCRFVTPSQNCRNRRPSKKVLTINGESRTIAEWAEIKQMPFDRLWGRVRNNWSLNELFLPVQNTRKRRREHAL